MNFERDDFEKLPAGLLGKKNMEGFHRNRHIVTRGNLLVICLFVCLSTGLHVFDPAAKTIRSTK